MKPEEIAKLTRYLRKLFGLTTISVRKGPKKDDMAEVYIAEEFVGTMHRDEEDGELSYHFQMAILDIDLDE